MATLGRWSGGADTTTLTSTSWTGFTNLDAEDRNDSSTYSFNLSTATLTLPASGLADGYLLIGGYAYDRPGRMMPQARFEQTSGTGNFLSAYTGGYCRNSSQDTAFVRTFAFVDSPSASAEFQFQWKRDTDGSGSGTFWSYVEVIPFYYSAVGMYSSASHSLYGGTTPNQVTGFAATVESDTSAIAISSNVITLKTNGARYFALGSQFFEGMATSGDRTQRWHGFDVDGTFEHAAKGYTYYRNGNNDESGEMFTWLIERDTTDITLEQACYRGDGVASGEGGAGSDGDDPGVGHHVTIVLELHDNAEVFGAKGSTNQDISSGTTNLQATKTGDIKFNDSASFTRTSDTAMDAAQAMDALVGGNIGGASESITSSGRYLARGRVTVNGTEDNATSNGSYLRGDSGSHSTFGYSANPMGFVVLASGDDIGISNTVSNSQHTSVHTQVGWVGFWGINLDTLEDTGGTTTPVNLDAGSYTLSGQPLGIAVTTKVDLDAGSYTFSGQPLGVQVRHTTAVNLDAGAYSLTGYDLGITLTRAVALDAGSYSLTGLDLGVTVSSTIALDAGSYAFAGHDLGIAIRRAVSLDAGSYAFTGLDLGITQTTAVQLEAGAYTLTGRDLTIDVTTGTTVDLDAGVYTFSGYDLGITQRVAVNLQAGSYTLTGRDLTIGLRTPVNLDAGSYGFTGYDLDISLTRAVALDAGSYTYSGYDITIRQKLVTCALVDRYGNALPDLVDLHWAWFDTTDPAVMGAPTDQGTTESTDGTGEIAVKVPNTALPSGGQGTLLLRSSDGASLGAYNLSVD